MARKPKVEFETAASKQSRYRERQRSDGVPTTGTVAMVALRLLVKWALESNDPKHVVRIQRDLRRELLKDGYTAPGIDRRLRSIVDAIEDGRHKRPQPIGDGADEK